MAWWRKLAAKVVSVGTRIVGWTVAAVLCTIGGFFKAPRLVIDENEANNDNLSNLWWIPLKGLLALSILGPFTAIVGLVRGLVEWVPIVNELGDDLAESILNNTTSTQVQIIPIPAIPISLYENHKNLIDKFDNDNCPEKFQDTLMGTFMPQPYKHKTSKDIYLDASTINRIIEEAREKDEEPQCPYTRLPLLSQYEPAIELRAEIDNFMRSPFTNSIRLKRINFSDEEIPEKFMDDTVTLEILEDPIKIITSTFSDGSPKTFYNLNKKTLEDLLHTNASCPMTNQPLKNLKCAPNTDLKKEIEIWLSEKERSFALQKSSAGIIRSLQISPERLRENPTHTVSLPGQPAQPEEQENPLLSSQDHLSLSEPRSLGITERRNAG